MTTAQSLPRVLLAAAALPRAVPAAVVAAALQGLQCAGVGALADVPVAGAGTRGDDPFAQPCGAGEVAEDDLGHR